MHVPVVMLIDQEESSNDFGSLEGRRGGDWMRGRVYVLVCAALPCVADGVACLSPKADRLTYRTATTTAN